MATVADYLSQLQKLTHQNLDILKTINESFFTKQNHLSVQIGDSNYAVPSFISLENKINYLQEAFDNLVNAPKTGEAFFNYDGSSRSIEVRGYSTTPNKISLNEPTEFGVVTNNLIKELLTPAPYVRFNLSSIPNDINTVNIKKIVPRKDVLVNMFSSILKDNNTSKYSWGTMKMALDQLNPGVDYIEYNYTKKLPIKTNIGHATYVIKDVLSDTFNDQLEEIIVADMRMDIDNPLYTTKNTYKLFDETLERTLQVGDELITYDNNAKLRIESIKYIDGSKFQVTLKVVNGEYVNLSGCSGLEIPDNSKLKFFSPVNFDEDKYIDVELSNEKYVYITIAPVNERMNVQAPWAEGVVINTHSLKNSSDESFNEYYDENVRNIGDLLIELSTITNSSINRLSKDEFEKLTKYVPVLNTNDLNVVRINTHLDTSKIGKNIRDLHQQKTELQAKLDKILERINEIDDNESKYKYGYISDSSLVNKSGLLKRRDETLNSINVITSKILEISNSNYIEESKYRIRGYFDIDNFIKSNNINNKHIKGIQVQYRYKAPSDYKPTLSNNAYVLNNNTPVKYSLQYMPNESYSFSNWNIMNGFMRHKEVNYRNNEISVGYKDNNEGPVYNQIDIPIQFGESVDIKLKVVYDYGYPFVEVSSDWSEVCNIDFPKELQEELTLDEIVKINAEDYDNNRFTSTLNDLGVLNHIDDMIADNTSKFYHKPENISSGFYNRADSLISLKEKLTEMDSLLTHLKDEVLGTASDVITVTLSNDNRSIIVRPDVDNQMILQPYSSFIKESQSNDGYIYESDDNGLVSTVLNLTITNNTDHVVKLYPMFPGTRSTILSSLKNARYELTDYARQESASTPGGVVIAYTKVNEEDSRFLEYYKLQTANQFLTFRLNDAYTNQWYYAYPSSIIGSINGSSIRPNVSVNINKYQTTTNETPSQQTPGPSRIVGVNGGGLGGVLNPGVAGSAGDGFDNPPTNPGTGTPNPDTTNPGTGTGTTNPDDSDSDNWHNSNGLQEDPLDRADKDYHHLNMGITSGATSGSTWFDQEQGGGAPVINPHNSGGSPDICVIPEYISIECENNDIVVLNSQPCDLDITYLLLKFNKSIKSINNNQIQYRIDDEDYHGDAVYTYDGDLLKIYPHVEKDDKVYDISFCDIGEIIIPKNTITYEDGDSNEDIQFVINKTQNVPTESWNTITPYITVKDNGVYNKMDKVHCTYLSKYIKDAKIGDNPRAIIFDREKNQPIPCKVSVDIDRLTITVIPDNVITKEGRYRIVLFEGIIVGNDIFEDDGKAPLYKITNYSSDFYIEIAKSGENSTSGEFEDENYDIEADVTQDEKVDIIIPNGQYHEAITNYYIDANNILPMVAKAYKNPFERKEGKYSKYGAIMYPKLNNEHGLCLDEDARQLVLNPNEELVIPIIFKYRLNETDLSEIAKTMSFDIRTSLYKDPINYKFKVIAKYENTSSDNIMMNNNNLLLDKSKYTKYITTVIK